MKKSELFKQEIFAFALITIILFRVWLGILEFADIQKPSYLIGIRFHHFYAGLIIIAIGAVIPKRQLFRTLSFGVGAGLMIDEITLPLQELGFVNIPYWSWLGVLTVIAGIIGLYYWEKSRRI